MDVSKLQPIVFDPMTYAYLQLGEKAGQAFHDGAQQRKMLGRPRLDIVPAGHRLRVLPQIQVDAPILRLLQGGILYTQFNVMRGGVAARCADAYASFVYTRCCILRDIDLEPHASVDVGRVRAAVFGADDVGHAFAVCLGVAYHAHLGGDAVLPHGQCGAGYLQRICLATVGAG